MIIQTAENLDLLVKLEEQLQNQEIICPKCGNKMTRMVIKSVEARDDLIVDLYCGECEQILSRNCPIDCDHCPLPTEKLLDKLRKKGSGCLLRLSMNLKIRKTKFG